MLAYILAIAIGLSSLALFLAAFFRPKLHRQDDFLWSGIGLFYALFLWLCSEQIRGGILLGQVAGVALVLTFGWQTLKLRLALANPEARAEIENFSLLTWIQNRLGGSSRKKQPSPPIPKTEKAAVPTATEQPVAEVTQTPAQATTQEIEEPIEETVTPEPEIVSQESIEKSATPEPKTLSQEPLEPSEPTTPEPTPEAVEPKTVSTPIEEITITSKAPLKSKAETPTKSGFSLKKLFGLGKPKSAPKPSPSKPETITAALDLSEAESDEFEEAIAPQNSESATPVESSEATPTLIAEIIKVETYVDDEKTETVVEAYQVTVEEATQSQDQEKPEVVPETESPEESVKSQEIMSKTEPSPAEESSTADKEDVPEKPSSSDSSNPATENPNKAQNPPEI
jgi:Ycf66 protein N-terminus